MLSAEVSGSKTRKSGQLLSIYLIKSGACNVANPYILTIPDNPARGIRSRVWRQHGTFRPLKTRFPFSFHPETSMVDLSRHANVNSLLGREQPNFPAFAWDQAEAF